MDQLIDTIRTAIAAGASTEQKAAGVLACRTIIAALDTEPGKPLVLPGTPSSSQPAARPSLDQMLDLAIAKLTMLANEHDKRPASPSPNGLRVPVIRAALPRVPTRSANKLGAKPKIPTRKP